MQTYYTGEDIEDMAARGITRLEIGSNVALTDIARELAHELGVELITARSRPSDSSIAPSHQPVASPAPLGMKPRGCQHGPIQAGAGAATATPGTSNNGVVNRLVDMVSRMADRGS